MANLRDKKTDGTIRQTAEQALIADLFAPLSEGFVGALDLKDDAATVTVSPDCELVVTKDMLVAGVHFFADDAADLIARKALRVNLSDLAAKGARPTCYFLAVALPIDADRLWLEQFVAGLSQDQTTYDCILAGGDTVRTEGPLTISVTAIGEVPSGLAVRRAGARPGDRVYVSGTIGDSVLGLALRSHKSEPWEEALDAEQTAFLKNRYLLPQPRTDLAVAVRDNASAAMDVSDGLAGDLALLCGASDVGAGVALTDIPLSPAARDVCAFDSNMLPRLISGGDDYEILCAVPADRNTAFEHAARLAGIEVSCIGSIQDAESGLSLFDESGAAIGLTSLSYSHL